MPFGVAKLGEFGDGGGGQQRGQRLEPGEAVVAGLAGGVAGVDLLNDHRDPVSMEGRGGGYIGFNTFNNNGLPGQPYDDAIDCDVGGDGFDERNNT